MSELVHLIYKVDKQILQEAIKRELIINFLERFKDITELKRENVINVNSTANISQTVGTDKAT